MNDFLSQWAASVLLAAALGGFGYWAGDHNRNNSWLVKVAKQEKADHDAFEAEVKRSNAAAAKATADQAELQANYSTLEGKFNALTARGPLVVVRNNNAGLTAVSTVPGAVPVAVSGAESPLAVSAAGVPDAGYGLTLGAVWMWNSALTGSDTPAGACTAADTAAEACAADSGLGVADAWQNHITNAKSCAIDRQRHQQLIDYLSAH